jgi:hypothetical protein
LDKVKDVLGALGRMLDPERVLAVTGHSVGGICPFGLFSPLPVYSLRRFEEVVPAAGSGNAALKIATERRRADERNLGRCAGNRDRGAATAKDRSSPDQAAPWMM